jgi:hypothetical protein
MRPKVNALHWKESGTLWRASAEIQLYIEKRAGSLDDFVRDE